MGGVHSSLFLICRNAKADESSILEPTNQIVVLIVFQAKVQLICEDFMFLFVLYDELN